MASASRDPAAAQTCFHHCCSFPSSTFKSTLNLGGNLPTSASLSSKLLDVSAEIRDTSQSQFSQLVVKQATRGHVTRRAACERHRAAPLPSRLPRDQHLDLAELQTSPEQGSPLQPCPFLSGRSCFPNRFAVIPAGSLANRSTTNTEACAERSAFLKGGYPDEEAQKAPM